MTGATRVVRNLDADIAAALTSSVPHGRRRPAVMPYPLAFIDIQPEMEVFVRTTQFGVGMLLLIVAVNAAILVYARTATRMGEIAVVDLHGAHERDLVSAERSGKPLDRTPGAASFYVAAPEAGPPGTSD